MPRDRTGNRRFIPIPVDAELAEVHILDNEDESRAYIDQLWAEAMTIYNSGNYKLAFRPAMQETLQAHQQDFMQEDAQAGMIYAFLEDYAVIGCVPNSFTRRHWATPISRQNGRPVLFARS